MADKEYTEHEKNKIKKRLNEHRLSEKREDEIKSERLENNKAYKLRNYECYKFLQMPREYYIRVTDCNTIGARPKKITLYYKAFEEVKKKIFLIKVMAHSKFFHISEDPIRVYFKSYELEKHTNDN